MHGYEIALSFHLLFVLLATAAAALATFVALRLRDAESAEEALSWVALVAKVVRAFPVAVLGLLVTGGYMIHARWNWSMPWVDGAIAGLALIVVLGSGVEASRTRALARALASEGMSPRARRLLRDPVAWTAKMMTLTLVVAVVFVMTVKPAAGGCVATIVTALVFGGLGAVPMWRVPMEDATVAAS